MTPGPFSSLRLEGDVRDDGHAFGDNRISEKKRRPSDLDDRMPRVAFTQVWLQRYR